MRDPVFLKVASRRYAARMSTQSDVSLALIELVKQLLVEQHGAVAAALASIQQQGAQEMADITALQAEVQSVIASEAAASVALDTLAQRIADLVAQLGSQIPQEQVNALTQALADARNALDARVAADNPPTT